MLFQGAWEEVEVPQLSLAILIWRQGRCCEILVPPSQHGLKSDTANHKHFIVRMLFVFLFLCFCFLLAKLKMLKLGPFVPRPLGINVLASIEAKAKREEPVMNEELFFSCLPFTSFSAREEVKHTRAQRACIWVFGGLLGLDGRF